MIHFERSPPDGDCFRRAIEVDDRKGVPVERKLRGGEGSRRKQQETIEGEAPKGSQSKESCGRGEAEGSSRRL